MKKLFALLMAAAVLTACANPTGTPSVSAIQTAIAQTAEALPKAVAQSAREPADLGIFDTPTAAATPTAAPSVTPMPWLSNLEQSGFLKTVTATPMPATKTPTPRTAGTVTPRPKPTLPPQPIAMANAGDVAMVSDPSAGAPAGTLPAGVSATVIGRTQDSQWLQVATGFGRGWVRRSAVTLSGGDTKFADVTWIATRTPVVPTRTPAVFTPTTVPPTLPPVITNPACPPGMRTGAICRDGTRSGATGSGACSHHKGVAQWLTC